MIEASEVHGATVLFLRGELDAASSLHVRDLVGTLVTEGRTLLVLELSGVERMYTVGMTALLELHREVERSGGRLVCCRARPFIREILRITMLDRFLDLQSDLESALERIGLAS